MLTTALRTAVQNICRSVVAVEVGPDRMVKSWHESDNRIRRPHARWSDDRDRIRYVIRTLAESQNAIAQVADRKIGIGSVESSAVVRRTAGRRKIRETHRCRRVRVIRWAAYCGSDGGRSYRKNLHHTRRLPSHRCRGHRSIGSRTVRRNDKALGHPRQYHVPDGRLAAVAQHCKLVVRALGATAAEYQSFSPVRGQHHHSRIISSAQSTGIGAHVILRVNDIHPRR